MKKNMFYTGTVSTTNGMSNVNGNGSYSSAYAYDDDAISGCLGYTEI
jgi:hypothetical protein